MPTSQKVQIDTFDFGESLTAPTLGALATGTTITNGTANSCNEQTVDSGVYIADFVGADASALIPAGTYRLRTTVNGLPLKRFVTFAGVDGEVVYARSEEHAVLDTGALRAALGMAAADLDDQLDAILAAGGAGTGARTVTITVNDGTTALQNATVRMTEGVNSYTALTDADGVAVFNLDDATYTVSITKSGYSYTGTTLVVNGTETATYSMTAISVTPPTSPSKSAIEVLCVDENVDAESGVAVDFRIVTIPTGDQNIAYKGTKQTATSDVDGIARFEVARGSVCEYKRGEADVWQRVTVDNDSVTNVTSFIGSP